MLGWALDPRRVPGPPGTNVCPPDCCWTQADRPCCLYPAPHHQTHLKQLLSSDGRCPRHLEQSFSHLEAGSVFPSLPEMV